MSLAFRPAIRLLVLLGPFLACLGVDPASGQTASRWFLAEGASNAFFDEQILIANPNTTTAAIKVTYLLPSGGPIEQLVSVPATSRYTIRVNSVAGLSNAGAVSAVVECTNGLDIVVERSMYWGRIGQTTHPASGHNSPGVLATATEWFLAEGSTGFFQTFILLSNPDPARSANVSVQFLELNGAVVSRAYTLPPSTRQNIWVNAEIPELANQPFSTVVRSTNGVGLVVERAMYFGANYKGGHGAVASARPDRQWLFAEGYTGGTPTLKFDTFLLLANPNATQATATVTFFLESGTPVVKTYMLLPTSRLNIWVDYIPELSNAAFSIEVDSDVPVLAERAMYWGGATWWESHDTPGVNAAATRWAFAEGVEDGIDSSGVFYDTYFLVANPGAAPLQLKATFYREDGTGVVGMFTVPGRSRFTMPAGWFPELSNQRFAAFLESTNGLSFVAERAVYWGVDYIGGHGSTGVAWSGTVPAPPAPPAATVSGIVPATGSSAGGTPVTITGTNFAAGATVSLGGSAATSVTVLNATTIVAVAGAHAIGTVDVVVTSNNRVATLPAAFTYSPAPQISGVSPAVGPTGGGTLLTITGSGFVAGATVRVGGVASGSVDVVNASTIRAVTPAHAVGTVDVEVVIAGVTATRPSSFTYLLPVPHTFAVATVAFGDSITYGTSSTIVTVDGSPAVRSQVIEGYPEKLQRAMRTRYTVQPVGVANEGIPGECASAVCFPAMDRGENRLAATLTPADDLVIILEGVNDLNGQRTISSIADALRRMVQTGKQDGRFVIITTLLPVKADEVSGVPRNDINRIRALNTEIRAIAQQEGVLLVDMYQAFGGDNVNQSLLSPDGLHPNAAGYQRMADVFFDAIRTQFEQFAGT